ncbi:MAG: aldo/keto reductase, partial [Chloroflexi bacterium]|nr:aldo/keto reductase [Chloroflexota bacterium]
MLAGRYADAQAFPENSRAQLRGGIYANRITDRAIEKGNQFVALAREHALDPAQLALCWVKDQPGISAPLIGVRTVEQLDHLLPVLEMRLDDELRASCDAIVPPGSAVANFHNTSGWMKAL